MTEKENCSPYLDTIDTNAHFPPSYRSRLLTDCGPEYQATHNLYSYFDSLRSKPQVPQLENCRSFAFFCVNKETRAVKIASNACKLRWCPLCARQKSKAISIAVGDYIAAKKDVKFLTLTLKHTEEPLSLQIENLYKSFRKFRRLKLFETKVRGGIWFFQVKKSKKDNCWHPHLHCIIDADYIDKFIISDKWHKVTKSSMVIDIRKVYKPDKVANYVARYSARPSNLSELEFNDTIELFTALHKRRLAGSWGTAKSVDLTGRKRFDRNDSIKLCCYSDAMQHQKDDVTLRTLIQCWALQQPLPDWVNLDYFRVFDSDKEDINQRKELVYELFEEP